MSPNFIAGFTVFCRKFTDDCGRQSIVGTMAEGNTQHNLRGAAKNDLTSKMWLLSNA